MIGGLRPYPDMKHSDVPWLGEVPAHWELPRLGALLQERGETKQQRGRRRGALGTAKPRRYSLFRERQPW